MGLSPVTANFYIVTYCMTVCSPPLPILANKQKMMLDPPLLVCVNINRRQLSNLHVLVPVYLVYGLFYYLHVHVYLVYCLVLILACACLSTGIMSLEHS